MKEYSAKDACGIQITNLLLPQWGTNITIGDSFKITKQGHIGRSHWTANAKKLQSELSLLKEWLFAVHAKKEKKKRWVQIDWTGILFDMGFVANKHNLEALFRCSCDSDLGQKVRSKKYFMLFCVHLRKWKGFKASTCVAVCLYSW